MNKAKYKACEVMKNYEDTVKDIGLWKSEEIMVKKYFNESQRILDVRCGGGRTTFNLYDMGYKNIVGIDYFDDMMEKCEEYGEKHNYNIEFEFNDVMNLSYEDESFDCCLASYNALMTIPSSSGRRQAFSEIRRVLKKGGILIFTTHNRNDPNYKEFWKEEKLNVNKRKQEQMFYEFGDYMHIDNTSRHGTRYYIHIPTRDEVLKCIKQSKFKLLFSDSRENICEESEEVKSRSSECIFWVVKKTA